MSSISIRFALASVSVALFILAFTGGINYLFLKKELAEDATQKAQLMEKNSRCQIETLISKAEKTSARIKDVFQEGDFSKVVIKKVNKSLTRRRFLFWYDYSF